MRMEMPERWSDIATIDTPMRTMTAAPVVSGVPTPSVWNAYFRRFKKCFDTGEALAMPPTPLWPTPQYEAAECLYMIIMEAVAEDGDSRSVFRSGDVADTDGDVRRNLSTAGERRSCFCVGRLVLTRSCRSWQAGKYRARAI